MNMLIIFPKERVFNRSVNNVLNYRKTISEWVKFLSDCNVVMEYLIEDNLAMEYIHNNKEIPDSRKKVISLICNADYRHMSAMNTKSTQEDFYNVFMHYNNTENRSELVTFKGSIDPTLIRSDKDAYLVKRTKLVYDHMRDALTEYAGRKRNVFMFTDDTKSNRISSVCNTGVAGDGRLLIEVAISTEAAKVVYGGYSLSKEALLSIIQNVED